MDERIFRGEIEEQYEGYCIKVNQIPEAQFAFSYGFGWAFEIFRAESRSSLCIVVLKSLSGTRTPANLTHGLALGREAVHSLIRERKFEREYYCYQWEPSTAMDQPATEVDCDKISPAPFRSPQSR